MSPTKLLSPLPTPLHDIAALPSHIDTMNRTPLFRETPVWRYQLAPYALNGKTNEYWAPNSALVPSAVVADIPRLTRRFDINPPSYRTRIAQAMGLRARLVNDLFLQLYQQDLKTWERCRDAAKTIPPSDAHQSQHSYNYMVRAARERILRDRECSMPIAPRHLKRENHIHGLPNDHLLPRSEVPVHPQLAIHHLLERFVTRMDGTVWMETLGGNAQTKVAEQVYRDALLHPVLALVYVLQSKLYASCRNPERMPHESQEMYDYCHKSSMKKWPTPLEDAPAYSRREVAELHGVPEIFLPF